MSEAFYGLLGALGGALITSAAAYWGPLQVQRRLSAAEAERSEISRREAEEARAEAQQQAEQERIRSAALQERERLEAAAVEAHALREAKVKRIISMRTITRTWSDLLARTVQDLELGRQVRVEEFDSELAVTRDKAQNAFDDALREGMWIPQSTYGYPVTGNRLHVLTALKHATDLTRAAVIRGRPLTPAQASGLRHALDRADGARGELSTTLLNRLEEVMSITVVDTSTQFITARGVGSSRQSSSDADLSRDSMTGLTALESQANDLLRRAQREFESAQRRLDGGQLVFDRIPQAVASRQEKGVLDLAQSFESVTGSLEKHLRFQQLKGYPPEKLPEALELRSKVLECAQLITIGLEACVAERLASAQEHVDARSEQASKLICEAERLASVLRASTGDCEPYQAAMQLRRVNELS